MDLTPAQVAAYLDRISLPEAIRSLLQDGPTGSDALKAVAALQRHHLQNIPFENLDLCYSPHKSIEQGTELVFDHAIQRKRGGVCDQIHPLFARLLRHFGFTVYLTGARINAVAGILSVPGTDASKPAFSPWVHLVTIVSIGDEDYLVDTSHGPSGSPTPVLLAHDNPEVDIYPRQRRMIHEALPGWSNSRQKWWRLQIKDSPEDSWVDVWCFTETEWQDVDIELLRLGYGAQGGGWVAPHVCCFKTIYEAAKPVGHVMLLRDELRRSYKGSSEVVQKFYSEEDRVQSIFDIFGITLSPEEQQCIIGHPSEIEGEDFDYYG